MYLFGLLHVKIEVIQKREKGSCLVLVAGSTVIVLLNLVCRNNNWGIIPKLIYWCGIILSLIGISLAFRSSIGVVGTLIIISCIYGYRIKIEESMLARYFNTSYPEYKKHSKRIIPFIW